MSATDYHLFFATLLNDNWRTPGCIFVAITSPQLVARFFVQCDNERPFLVVPINYYCGT